MSIEHFQRQANGVHLHVAATGEANAPLVILLHGFPEFWGSWRAHMMRLADAGFRVLAPDQRGYNTSDKPGHVSDYALDILANDIVGLIDAEQRDKAIIVGHDWGGAVAWRVAQLAPERVGRVAVLNCPPTDVMQQMIWKTPRQLLKSWYMFSFQIPWIPEWYLGRDNGSALAKVMVETSQPGTFSDETLSELRQAWARDDALRAMLGWYRAGARHPPRHAGRITVPSLLIWGEQDRFLGTQLIEPTMALCDQGQLIRFPSASHWVNHEEVDAVCSALESFFQS